MSDQLLVEYCSKFKSALSASFKGGSTVEEDIEWVAMEMAKVKLNGTIPPNQKMYDTIHGIAFKDKEVMRITFVEKPTSETHPLGLQAFRDFS